MFRFVGISHDGVKRVYGYAKTEAEAKAECEAAVLAYCRRRPDVGWVGWHMERQPDEGPQVIIHGRTTKTKVKGEPLTKDDLL